jgi:methionine-rich copper-binding protein CopC
MTLMARRLRQTDEVLLRRASHNVNDEMEKRYSVGDRLADRMVMNGGGTTVGCVGRFSEILLMQLFLRQEKFAKTSRPASLRSAIPEGLMIELPANCRCDDFCRSSFHAGLVYTRALEKKSALPLQAETTDPQHRSFTMNTISPRKWDRRLAKALFATALRGQSRLFAHTSPVTKTPAADATVSAPDSVTINFTGALEPKFSMITVTDASGHVVNKEASVLGGDTNSRRLQIHGQVVGSPIPALNILVAVLAD